MNWVGNIFLDVALPFGLRSAPKIFSAVADTLLWIMAQRGVDETVHYLDDFLLAGCPHTYACAQSLSINALDTCQILGVPEALETVEGPSTSISYLGIMIDSVKGDIHLPKDKLSRIT